MGIILLLLALQFAASAAGLFYLWRRQQRQGAEIESLRTALAAAEARAKPQRRAVGADASVVPLAVDADANPLARAARAWSAPGDLVTNFNAPTLSPETGRGLVLALIAALPAVGFFLREANQSAVVASGLTIAAAMMMISLRPMWRAAAWAAVMTAGAWALLGFALAAAHRDPASYSICVALAGAAGLAHAHLRRATPGATLSLTMAAAALALGSQSGMIGPAGGAFAFIVACAATVGAMSLRLEAIHLASFGAALIGLFVLSGQDSAAIWFTPAATWAGALFLGIAALRVPQLGARGVALAGTGMLAPFAAIAALHSAQHGLADRFAAAGAFLALGAMLAAIIAMAATRRDRGVAALKVTLWVLSLGAFASSVAAITLALPAALAAIAFGLLALSLLALNWRLPDAAWRTFAWAAGAFGLVFSLISAQVTLAEAQAWPPALAVAMGLVVPAIISGGAAFLAGRANAPATAAYFEALTMLVAIIAANLFVRLVFTGGATLLQPIGFVEAGAHFATWLAGALVIGARLKRGARALRLTAVNTLTFAALGGAVATGVLWMTSYFAERTASAAPQWLQHETLGFLIPSILFWLHWVFWRARGNDAQTRLVMAVAALSLAAFVTLEALRAEGAPGWLGAFAGAVSFAFAIGINFAPGVTNQSGPRR